ncbi:MAG: hypothetical protein JSR82_19945 [Verrucomicrobia bacterium]|nr:hypothetical protein [Verrucomicrobiota bacterium]
MLDPKIRPLAAQAFQEFSRHNFSAAELLCRQLIDVAPKQPEGYDLLGMVLGSLGHRQKAIEAFQQALIVAPGYAQAMDNLYTAAAMDLPPKPPTPRYLVIKAWGFGFWADVAHVLAGLLLCECTGRTPVVHWGANSQFADDSGAEAFRHFFQPVSDVELSSLAAQTELALFPAKWTHENLLRDDENRWDTTIPRLGGIYYFHRAEPVLVSDHFIAVVDLLPYIPRTHELHGQPLDLVWHYLVTKYLKPQPDLQARIDAFAATHLEGKNVQAVHVPGSITQSEEVNAEELAKLYEPLLAALDPAAPILLLADELRTVNEFKARFGERLILTDEATAAPPDTDERVALGRTAVIDTFLALRCARFLGHNGSYFSAFVSVLRNWPPGACRLLGPAVLNQRDVLLYLDPQPA